MSCQNERSQIQNKASAMDVLQAKLLERRRQEEQALMDALKDDGSSSWGNQMRTYVLHPYQMVKDLRTDYETGNPGRCWTATSTASSRPGSAGGSSGTPPKGTF